MRFISNIIDRWRVWNTLLDYPVYSPPFRDAEAVLSKEEIKANFDYFLQQKLVRREYLASYLRLFSVELRLAGETLPPLDRWIHRYGGHLIPSGGQIAVALHDYELAWRGEYHGLNVVHDIAAFAGDYMISKNNQVRWDAYYGSGAKNDYDEPGFGHPCLFGLAHPSYQGVPCDVLRGEMYECFMAGYFRLKSGRGSVVQEWDTPGQVVRRLEELADPNPPPLPSYSEFVMRLADDLSSRKRRS